MFPGQTAQAAEPIGFNVWDDTAMLYGCQVYDEETGIKLTPDAAGLCIVRAIAVTPGLIPSELFLSKSVSFSLVAMSDYTDAHLLESFRCFVA